MVSETTDAEWNVIEGLVRDMNATGRHYLVMQILDAWVQGEREMWDARMIIAWLGGLSDGHHRARARGEDGWY